MRTVNEVALDGVQCNIGGLLLIVDLVDTNFAIVSA